MDLCLLSFQPYRPRSHMRFSRKSIPTVFCQNCLSQPPIKANISKKRKFVADGVFYAELNEVRPTLLSFFLP